MNVQCPFYTKQTWTQSSRYIPRKLNGRDPWEMQTDYIYSLTYINHSVIFAATHWEITALSSKLKGHLSIPGKIFWEPPLCETAMCSNQGAGFLYFACLVSFPLIVHTEGFCPLLFGKVSQLSSDNNTIITIQFKKSHDLGRHTSLLKPASASS